MIVQVKNYKNGLKMALFLLLFLNAAAADSSFAQTKDDGRGLFSKEAPIWLDFDMETIPEPKEVETGYLYDWADGSLFRPVRNGFGLKKLTGKSEALNFNTWDEVPDSSWFTNRIGVREMSPAEIKRGPNASGAPRAGKLTIIKGKTVGITPGFWVRDESGAIFILKFDPPANPEMASGAEIITTKLFYAIGYNVPENYIFRFRREDLLVSEKTGFTDEKGKKRRMTEADLNLILSRVARQPDGRYRALASKLIAGVPKGGFTFSGVRRDDANDLIPHERRRDLRSLRIFSAWLEHNDVRVGNTLDVYVEEEGRKFIRHFLIDFGSALGSDTAHPNLPEVGREYRIDFNEAAKILLSAGIYQPKWRSENFDPVYSPAVGRFSARGFDPFRWKQNFPLAAFAEMTERGAFWAARLIARFTPEQIGAAVESAEYSDPADAEYLTRRLLERQQIIVETAAKRRAGFGGFKLRASENGYVLHFEDFRHFRGAGSGGKYFYRLQATGKNDETLFAHGEISEPVIAISPGLLQRIYESNVEEKEISSVARLSLSRPNEKQAADVYLFAETPRILRIAGIVH